MTKDKKKIIYLFGSNLISTSSYNALRIKLFTRNVFNNIDTLMYNWSNERNRELNESIIEIADVAILYHENVLNETAFGYCGMGVHKLINKFNNKGVPIIVVYKDHRGDFKMFVDVKSDKLSDIVNIKNKYATLEFINKVYHKDYWVNKLKELVEDRLEKVSSNDSFNFVNPYIII